MASIALIVLANSFYDPSNSKETVHEIQAKLNAYKNAPVQTVEAVIGALQHLDMLTSSGQVLCLSLLEQSINASFQSLPDEARGLVYQALVRLALPDPSAAASNNDAPISAAVQSVASKVLARVVALSYAVTFEPFMTALMAQLRAPFTGAAAAGDPAAMAAAIGKSGQVQQGLRLLYECLVMWLNSTPGQGQGGQGGANRGKSTGGGGDPFQASIRMAKNAVLANMPSVLELLMAILSLRSTLPPSSSSSASSSSSSSPLTVFDREITSQILAIFEHLAQTLPDPSALLAREDLLGLLSSLSWTVVQPVPADGEIPAALTVAQDTATGALGVITILVQRGLTTNSAAAVTSSSGSGGGGGVAALNSLRFRLMGLCLSLMAAACGGGSSSNPSSATGSSPSSSSSSSFSLPDLATAYSHLSSLEDSCAWSLRAFVEACVAHLLPSVEAAADAMMISANAATAAASAVPVPVLFSALDLCTVLFSYTLAQSSSEAFIALLSLWGQLAERVCSSASASSSSSSYIAAFRGLAGQLLAKVLYSTNAAGLELLSEDTAVGDEDEEEEALAAGAVVGVQFGGGGGSSSSSASAYSYLAGTSVSDETGNRGGDDGPFASDGGGSPGAASALRGPPSLHRLSTAVSSRTRLPSSAYTLKSLQMMTTSAFAAVAAAAANALPSSSSASAGNGGDYSGVHTPSSNAGGASSSSSSSGDQQDEDDEMLLASSLAQGTVLAEIGGGSGGGGAGGGIDGSEDEDALLAGDGFAAGGGDGSNGGGSRLLRLSERARYIQSCLLLLAKLASAASEIHADVLSAAGTSLQASCSSLVASASTPSSSSLASSSSSSPLAQHASDVAVLFALLSDLAQAASPGSSTSNSSDSSSNNNNNNNTAETQKAIVTMATQMLSLSVSSGWILIKTLPLLRVMASSLLTIRAFLPTLEAHARAAIYPLGPGSGSGSSFIPLDCVLSFVKDAVSCCLQLLDTSVLPPPPAVITDACVALLVKLSQQPILRVVSRSSALPSLHEMLFPAAVLNDLAPKLQAASPGTVIQTQTGWHKLMATLPASHQSHVLLAGLRFALAVLPPGAPSGATGAGAGAASSSAGVVASPAAGLSPMGGALLSADAPAEARAAAAHALLSPFLTAIHDALSAPSSPSSASSSSLSGAVGTAAIVSPLGGSSFTTLPGAGASSSSSASSLAARLSRAIGLLCAVLNTSASASASGGAAKGASGGGGSNSGSTTGSGLLSEGCGIGPSLQSVIAPLLAPILSTSCAVVTQLVDAAASPLPVVPPSSAAFGAMLGAAASHTLLLGGSKSMSGVSSMSGSSSGSGSPPPPLLSCGELLRLFAAAVAVMRRAFTDDYLLQALSVVGPQLIRLRELAGDASSSSSVGAKGVPGAASAPSPSPSPSSPQPRALAGILPCILYLLRLLRACAAPGALAVPLGSPLASSSSSNGGTASAASSLRQAIMAAVAGPVKTMASCSSEPPFRFAEEIAPCSMTLARAVLRNQWRFLVSAASNPDPTTGKRSRTFVSQDAANGVYSCLSLFTAWLANASASPELFRFALLNVLALQKETGNSLWNLASVQEQTLPEMEVVLLDAILKGERPTLSDEVTKALVAMAMTHREDFVARVLPAWMGKALGAENIASVIGRLDPAVGATLTAADSSNNNADDYADALLCLISAVRSWQLIKQEAIAVAAGTTVPVY